MVQAKSEQAAPAIGHPGTEALYDLACQWVSKAFSHQRAAEEHAATYGDDDEALIHLVEARLYRECAAQLRECFEGEHHD